jgi:hypothetical protein
VDKNAGHRRSFLKVAPLLAAAVPAESKKQGATPFYVAIIVERVDLIQDIMKGFVCSNGDCFFMD